MAEKFHFRFKIEARNFRHGAGTPEKKPTVSYPETESFLYLTGIFIRLVISENERKKTVAAVGCQRVLRS